MSKDSKNSFEKELPGFENYFSQISETTDRFAKEYNLLIDKYSYKTPAWNLRFSHPNCGEAYIEISRNIDDMIGVSGHWIVDEYDEFKKYIKGSAPILIPVVQKKLLYQYLTKELGAILEWKKNTWSSVSEGYKKDWGRYSKEKFYALKNILPTPNTGKHMDDIRSDVFKVIVICSSCKYENKFNQPYPYHAGFGDQGFLYNEEGNLTLIWSSYDKMYSKLFCRTHPWILSSEQRNRLENMLYPSLRGGRWRFENAARCCKCGGKIMSPLLENIYYLHYDGSVDTEKLDRGFAEVIKK